MLSVHLSRLADEGGAHAVAAGLLRDAVEALSLVAHVISRDSDKIPVLNQRFDAPEKWTTYARQE